MKNSMFLRLAALVATTLILASCGGGGGGGGGGGISAGTTVISGIVSDDAIDGATVTATSLSTGQALGSTTTGANGSFTMNVPTSQIGTGYSLASAGGTMNGQAFDGNLVGLYPANANPLQANLTLLTSLFADAANNTTRHTGTALQKHEAIKAEAISRGEITSDYFLVEPTGSSAIRLAAMRNQVLNKGVSATIKAHADEIGQPDCPTGSTCVDVSAQGESLFMSLPGGATVSADAGSLRGCRVVASFNEAGQAMTMKLKNINPAVVSQCQVNQVNGRVSLMLPPSTAEVPADACLTPLKRGSSTQSCVTIGSGMTPTYFFDDGTGHNHRTDKNPHSSIPAVWQTVKFSRSYGAVLNSSAAPRIGPTQNQDQAKSLAQGQWQGKTPVIFVNGFTLGDNFGGTDDTWGKLPQLVAEDTTVVVLNFQWKTDASFLTIAGELAKAVDYAYLSTGNKVHIVAHSFGGVLSRVMLQNIRGDTTNSASKVATLTTVGTPHSGIVTSGAPFEVEGASLPQGGGAAILSLCKQISCYEAGLDIAIAPWATDDLACPAHIPTCPVGTISPARGYINARLADFANHPFPTGLKVLVLIGQIIENKPIESTSAFSTPAFFTPTFSTDDDLISYFGQRFDPRAGRTLLSGSLKGGATITERVLGLPTGAEGFPGERVGSTMVTSYSYGPNHTPSDPAYPIGYGHSPAIPLVWLKAKLKGVNYEVNVPESCGTAADPCQHDTWLNLKEVLWLNPAFTVSLNGLQASFDASTSTPGANITGYSWSFGDGATASGATASHTFAASNTPWSVTLTVTDSYGRTASTFQNVSSTCPTGQVLQNGQCVTPAPTCTAPQVLANGVCITPAAAPTVTLSASPSSVAYGTTATISWSSANSTSCTLSGGGGTGTTGSFTTPPLTTTTTYTVVCSGSAGTTPQQMSVTVTVADSAPVTPLISSLSLASVPADSTAKTLTIYGGHFASGNVVKYRWLNPAGGNTASATVNSASQLSASFNPGNVADTIYVKVCQSSTSTSCSGELAISVTALAPPLAITTTAFNPATATVGTGYSALQAVTATGGQAPYSCSASGLPGGMAMNSSSCAIYGTPSASGTFNVTVTVTDSSTPQKTASKVLILTVQPSAPATPSLSSISPGTIAQGTSYQNVTFTGSNFTASSWPQFSINGGSSWAWATSAPTYSSPTSMTVGVNNTVAQTIYWRVCASNGSTSCSGSQAVSVQPAASPLTITTTAFNPATATVGTGYAAQAAIAATGGQTPYSCSASGLPGGMAMNSSSCAIYGTPSASGTFNVTVTVTDSSTPQKTASKVLALTVQPSAPAPVTLVVNGVPSSYIATAGTYQPSNYISGSGFSLVNQVYLTCSRNGISCGNYTWTPANWSGKFVVINDALAVFAPTLTVSSDPLGTYSWSVTFSGGGQSAIKYFTVTK